LHPQFVPRRDDRFDYSQPVDGAEPATDWQSPHALDELPHVLNPAGGWVMNTNNWPYSAAGQDSPSRDGYPRYMDTAGENFRGIHARRVLEGQKDFTLDSLQAAAFDSYLPGMAQIIPLLLRAYDALDTQDSQRPLLAEPVHTLREWNDRWSASSVATTLASLWTDEIWSAAKLDPEAEGLAFYDQIVARTTASDMLAALQRVVDRLRNDFGDWRLAWGDFNRAQRLTGAITQSFDDARPSVPIPFTSSRWGSLASFGARRYAGARKYYGTSGNSFVAVVEFGDRVKARAVSIGGESGNPASIHFADQTSRYAEGQLRQVHFYPDELAGHTESEYAPRVTPKRFGTR
ncbi:MAG: penicillin acylase family protein, partial [Pseudomonadota bacterium]|nr:penicillin acylase family protein [Pseudomonadota bacterium]